MSSVVAALKACGVNPYNKLHAIRHRIRGSGLRVKHYLQFVEQMDVRDADTVVLVGGKKPACRLPARLRLNTAVLSLFGLYVAEGNAQARYIVVANRYPVLRQVIEGALDELAIPFTVRPSSDYQISSKALTHLMQRTCGGTASRKRLPDFWSRLSNGSLGVLLRAYFDGDGTVGTNGEVTATTASEDLANDLALCAQTIWYSWAFAQGLEARDKFQACRRYLRQGDDFRFRRSPAVSRGHRIHTSRETREAHGFRGSRWQHQRGPGSGRSGGPKGTFARSS